METSNGQRDESRLSILTLKKPWFPVLSVKDQLEHKLLS